MDFQKLKEKILSACNQVAKSKNNADTRLQTISAEYKKSDKMDKQEFWKIIGYAVSTSNNLDSLKPGLIVDKLVTYSPDQIVEFEVIFRQLVIDADDYKVMAADKIIEGWVTDDPYLYFRCWLIGQGQKTYTETLKDPDYLATMVDRRTDIYFEELMYVATTAFEQKTGKMEEDDSFPRNIAIHKGLDYDFGAPPTKGTDWTDEQLPKLYPKLWAKFH